MSGHQKLKEFGGLISRYAPTLGSVVGTFCPIAGIAIKLIGDAFGVASNNIDDITTAINNDPNAAVKLKQIEMDHANLLITSNLQDVESAREREETIVKITGKKDSILNYIAFVVIFGYFIMCVVVAFDTLKPQEQHILYMMLGHLTSGFVMVLSYYFGSSAGAHD